MSSGVMVSQGSDFSNLGAQYAGKQKVMQVERESRKVYKSEPLFDHLRKM
jgi:hypothetical protein